MSRTRLVPVLLLVVPLALAGCSSDGGSDGDASPTTVAPATTAAAGDLGDDATTSTTVAPEVAPLRILVSNDDGYGAEGIDALVQGLTGLDDVEVTVVAPLAQQSGTGGSSTEGPLAVTDVELVSGYPARAVDGFPADTIRVAVDEQGVEADLVITGINSGQNLGPLVDISGTVGAARAAVARDIPALATSQGFGDSFDYAAAVPLILDWVEEHRNALVDGSAPVVVTNLNVPSCPTGAVRGLAEVPADLDGDAGQAATAQDCTSTTPLDQLGSDVQAFTAGYATIDELPSVAAATP